MRIGLTYDLREAYLAAGYGEEETAEFDSPETIAALERALRGLGHDVERVGNVRDLAARLVGGARWDLVFNIAEGLAGVSREAQVPALLEAYGILYTFSDPLVMALTLDKGVAKRVVRDHGLPTAPFAVVATEHDIGRIDLPFPLFVKPIAEGTGKGIEAGSLVRRRGPLRAACRHLLTKFRQPVLVETYLPGREFTVGIIGSGESAEVLGVMEIELLSNAEGGSYSYENKEHYEDRVRYRLVRDREARLAALTAFDAWRAIGCHDAGRVDLRSDTWGVPQFLEVNPLAGLHPVRSDLVIMARLKGLTYEDLIGSIVRASTQRHGLAVDHQAPARSLAT